MNGSVENDTTPPFVGPHDGRELELMLEGKKPLSMFSVDDAVEYENYPDKRFDALTSEGRFVKEVRIRKLALVNGGKCVHDESCTLPLARPGGFPRC